MRRRRVWCELLPLEEVRSPAVLGLLARHGLELAIAVRPGTLPDLPALCRAASAAGVPLAIWPMIADDAGRWASEANAAEFVGFVEEVLARLAAEELAAREVVFDLEPPLPVVRRVLGGGIAGLRELLRGAWKPDPGAVPASRIYRDAIASLGARGIEASAAIVPLLLRDGAARGWERALGTPVTGIGYRGVNAMIYTSMLAGWSRGLLRRADAVSLLGALCRAARRRYGVAAGASLGVVGVGALGDEPIYGGVNELREDVAVARAAGIEDLALFDLGGVLARPPAEAWLEAFTATPPAPPGRGAGLTLRARCALAAVGLAQIARRAALPW